MDEAKEYIAKFVDINAMIATTYTYNFNKPYSDRDNYLVINKHDNTFAIYDAFLQVARNREDEDFGFTLNMDWGETAEFTGSDWNGTGFVGDHPEEGNSFELREAFGTYKLPWGGIKIKAGKFVTLLGYEVLMTNTAFNPNITHSILFGYAINFTNVGILANIPLGEIAWMDIGVINGWDNAIDNNHDKTLMMGIGAKPADMFVTYLAGTFGSEVNGQAKTCDGIPCPGAGAGAKRGVVTWNWTLTLPEETGVALIMDSVYGNESDALPNSTTGDLTESADWYGVVGYATWAPQIEGVDGLSFALRGEWFGDPDGYRNANSTANPAVIGTAQTLWEITPTVAYQFADHFTGRLEYRYDHSNKLAYEKEGGYSNFAQTLVAEVIVAF